jgi:carbonic anhydrase
VPDPTLATLLERNARHVESLPGDHFAAVAAGQTPPVVSVCCSDSRVSQEGMWDVDRPGWLFTPSTIGNQTWDLVDGEVVVDGSVLYPMVETATDTALVVGHTGCGAVAAALAAVRGDRSTADLPRGVAKWVDLLVPVVADGLADDRTDPGRDASLVDQLVEFNVDRQVAFLRESADVPDDQTIFGFVYDFQGVYGTAPGRTYLVNADGETALDALHGLVPDEYGACVERLLPPEA